MPKSKNRYKITKNAPINTKIGQNMYLVASFQFWEIYVAWVIFAIFF